MTMTPDQVPSTATVIDEMTYANEKSVLESLVSDASLSNAARQAISQRGATLVEQIRQQSSPGLMEVFLAEYGLSTDEGIALMCLAEALLRVPDDATIDELIEDKIAPSNWAKHMGHSTSPLVNAATWALMLTGKLLQDTPLSPVGHLRAAIKRVGEPVIRIAVNRAMEEMGKQFVLGETIQKATKRASKLEEQGYTYSYDMLGEAARTDDDAKRYHLEYSRAITSIAEVCNHDDIHQNPGISVKLSALFPRYELAQKERVFKELVPRVESLALLAKSAGMAFTIDAEESNRLTLSLQVIKKVLSQPELAGWNGFGVVVQAYGKRASNVLDFLYKLANDYDRRITIRLVKGAYWDSEIKQAQVMGMTDFPVFTTKAATDVSYIANAKRLLSMTDRVYPQFATHNAHTVAAILHLASDDSVYEFQRLHGMGEQLHELVKDQEKTRCRIYAPVGAHQDLLAYLVRRLLENGANSSFVNQVIDEDVAPEEVVADPFLTLQQQDASPIPTGHDMYKPERRNSKSWDLEHYPTLLAIEAARQPFKQYLWQASPLIAGQENHSEKSWKITNPANTDDHVGDVAIASHSTVDSALEHAATWDATPAERAAILNKVADNYETHFGELFALLAREAGKTLMDAVAEVREAVDFLRYYATQITDANAIGIFTCISPWNFPLAIFTGQISAALATGNAVLAKPSEQTSLIAYRAVQLMHDAGVPKNVVQLLPGAVAIGVQLTSDPRVSGVAFTGSTDTAKLIRKSMAENLKPGAPLLAETGGLNAMIVDSTALPEQAVEAVMQSAFQSAGQRCSALRCLYLQEDIEEPFLDMLFGAMEELTLADPWELSTDSGPIIDQSALDGIAAHVKAADKEGRLLKQLNAPETGTFFGPAVIRLNSIQDLEREIFGPVLHICSFNSGEINQVISDINNTGYGLTFGLQTRIDDRVEDICQRIEAGNIYVNRNQIGAIVGTQPFGGNGLSGTGPKAGGPHYIQRFYQHRATIEVATEKAKVVALDTVTINEKLASLHIDTHSESVNLPGPTGESNQLSSKAKAPLLCLGPGKEAAAEQARLVTAQGGLAIELPDNFETSRLKEIGTFSAVIWWGDEEKARELDIELSQFPGPLLALITGTPDQGYTLSEQLVCVDTTASGGNTELLSNVF